MTRGAQVTTLGMVLTELAGEARLLIGSDKDLDRPVTGASVVTDAPLPDGEGIALICPAVVSANDAEHLSARMSSSPSRLLVLTTPSPVSSAELNARLGDHVVIGTTKAVDPAAIVLSIARSVDVPDETATRRLASLQRSLTQVLGDSDPIVSLLARLKSTCNATVALVDKHGQAVHSTGPVPLSLLFAEISHTSADTQMMDIDGWHGIADRVNDPSQGGDHMGWLIAVARRDEFPDAYTVSAVHLAAALVEASQRMTLVARQQERAIRAAILEEALALRGIPDDPELAGRLASLGLAFADDLRTVVVRPVSSRPAGRRRTTTKELADGLDRALEAWDLAHLVSARDKFVVILVQASPPTLRRIIVAFQDSMPALHVGVGRAVRAIGDVKDSYHDAHLAVRSLSRTARSAGVMGYEDFDFATRLFSDVGTDRMVAWAREFLAPLDERAPLMEGLRTFFAHSQNMNAAADALSIHHNSLRYRLAKVEELLKVTLRDPAAVSSLFLALAARDLEEVDGGAQPRATRAVRTDQPSDVEAPRTPTDFATPGLDRLGVVIGPGR